MTRIRTIKDLAELAGVTAGTVSRALAGSELISTKTRERIQALADEHGFRPNVMARNLRTQRTGAIGVVIPPIPLIQLKTPPDRPPISFGAVSAITAQPRAPTPLPKKDKHMKRITRAGEST